jgi:hypothetical protein
MSYWYTLRRMTPLLDPSQKDDWSTIEISPESARAHFVKHSGLNCDLALCTDLEPAEFTLEKRELLQSHSGSAIHSQPGEFVERLYVRRGKSLPK